MGFTASNVSVFEVILVRIFPHSDWMQRDTPYLVRMLENSDHNNSEYEHFLRSDYNQLIGDHLNTGLLVLNTLKK